ncbi:hypothetical protein H4582DRAFT_2064415 [Lactarius indigo]|nr:hypothetical protein H4582DRAFT_2064415 [Lactarius indigo]
MDDLRTGAVAAGRGETHPHETTTCVHDSPHTDIQHPESGHTVDNLRQHEYIEPASRHDVRHATKDDPEPPSFINKRIDSTPLNRAMDCTSERSPEWTSSTQAAHEMSTKQPGHIELRQPLEQISNMQTIYGMSAKRLNDTGVGTNEPHAQRLEHADTDSRDNCEETRTTKHRTLYHEKDRQIPETNYGPAQKERINETDITRSPSKE